MPPPEGHFIHLTVISSTRESFHSLESRARENCRRWRVISFARGPFLYLRLMKSLSAIIGMYLLYTVCVPCCDIQECKWGSTAQEISMSVNSDHHEDATSACTPFCHCCCVSSVTLPLNVQVDFARPEKIGNTFFHSVPVTSADHSSVWQPPRIG